MSAILIRNIPEDVHEKLRARAKREGRSVEALARAALTALSEEDRAAGIDFEALAKTRAEHGVREIGEDWIEDFDDPAFSRAVLGLDEE